MVGILPPWVLEDGNEPSPRDRLSDPAIRRRLRTECDRYWRFIHRGEWHRVRLMRQPAAPGAGRLPFPEIAARRGTDEWDSFFDLLVDAGAGHGPSCSCSASSTAKQHLADMVGAPAVHARGGRHEQHHAPGPLADRTQLPLIYAGQIDLPHEVRARHRAAAARGGRAQDDLDARHPLRAARARPAGAWLRSGRRGARPGARSATPATLEQPAIYAEGVDARPGQRRVRPRRRPPHGRPRRSPAA